MSRTTPLPRDGGNQVEFRPPSGARQLAGLVLLVSLVATGLTGYNAWQAPTWPHLGTALVFTILTGFVWAVRAGAPPVLVTLRGGQVTVQRGEVRNVFDLTSRYTPVEVIGRPGQRDWQVVFHRHDMEPFVIDDSMVDPHEFTAAIDPYLRPPSAGPEVSTQ